MTSLEKGLDELSIQYDQHKINQLNQFYNLLISWNSVMNLTAITEYEDVVVKHFIDSVSIVHIFPDIQNGYPLRMIDMGTGAGFPGIPIKILFPHVEIVLMDSLNKRIKFLNQVIEELELSNVIAIHARAEELAHKDEYREQFDLCVSRAVAKLSTLSEYCMPFVKKGGYFIPFKSAKSDEEIAEGKKAIGVLGGELFSVKNFLLPNTDIDRNLVLIAKKNHSPKKYPRAGGKPLKTPIN